MRQPDAFVARRIRLNAALLENGGQVLDRLPDRLAFPPCAGELDDEAVDVVDREFVQAKIAQDGQDPTERHAVQHACRLGDIDSGGTPALARLGNRWRSGRLDLE